MAVYRCLFLQHVFLIVTKVSCEYFKELKAYRSRTGRPRCTEHLEIARQELFEWRILYLFTSQ